MSSFASRAAGRLSGRPALGTTIHHTMYTGSRFLLVFLLPSLGYLVETGIEFSGYFFIVIASLFLMFIISIYILLNLNRFQLFFQKLFDLYSDSTIPMAFLKTLNSRGKKNKNHVDIEYGFSLKNTFFKKTFVSFVAYSFLSTGFFIAFLLSLEFLEYRLTLSQFTATFHGIGAVIVSFYLDPMLSRSIDEIKNNVIWLNNLYSILLGRVIAYLATSILFFMVYTLFYQV
jgi:hypothetical protein